MNSTSCTDKAFKNQSVALGFVELQFVQAAALKGNVAFALGWAEMMRNGGTSYVVPI